jgi:hypothetical protein
MPAQGTRQARLVVRTLIYVKTSSEQRRKSVGALFEHD